MIQIKNLSFQYGKSKPLFDQLSLSLPSGNIYGLLGQNGAGKSTLLKLVSGMLFPNQGSLNILGYQPKDRVPGFLSEIYLIAEEAFVPDLKMERFVNLYSPFYPRFNHDQFTQYLNEFKLEGNQKLSALSYGQKKKFLLSFGLATDCKLLLLDEPTNGLDIPSKSLFRKIVASAIHEERSIIISTHQVRDMENLIDPIIILNEGKVVLFEHFEQVSQKLAVHKRSELPAEEDFVYAESTFAGHTVVSENSSGEESNIGLELLFNAVVSNPSKIQEIFKKP